LNKRRKRRRRRRKKKMFQIRTWIVLSFAMYNVRTCFVIAFVPSSPYLVRIRTRNHSLDFSSHQPRVIIWMCVCLWNLTLSDLGSWHGRSQWPRGLRRGSATAGLLGLRVRVVSIVCCQVEVSASGWSLVQRSPTERGMSECDREASMMRRHAQ
jgi:hypothetical protein